MEEQRIIEELNLLEQEIEEQEIELTKEEEKSMQEILKLKNEIKGVDVMKGFGQVALRGVEDYINSFIDTSEIIDDLKTPGAMVVDSRTIGRQATVDPNDTDRHRKMFAAEKSPYPNGAKKDFSNLNERTQKKIRKYEKAYRDRTKTVVPHHHTNKKDNIENDITLSGLYSYRFGPTVPIYTPEQYKEMYEAAGKPDNISTWIRKVNFDRFYTEASRIFGFSSGTSMETWAKENHLSIHETPNGMYLIPEDVHNAERHLGEASKIHAYLDGKISKEDMNKFEQKEKIMCKVHDGAIRIGRVTAGAAMSTVKIFVQKASSIIVTEVYFEFKKETEESLGERIKRIILSCIDRFKKELKDIKKLITQQLAGNALTEVLTLINDLLISYLTKTIKNIFKVIRQMMGSIIQTFKILVSKEYSWSEKFYEASKILSAGLVAVLGYSLNTLLEQLFAKIPVLNTAASVLADLFSGLIACILSAIVLSLFDSYKQQLILSDKTLQLELQTNRLLAVKINLGGLDAIKTETKVIKNAILIGTQVEIMESLGYQTDENIDSSTELLKQIAEKRKHLNILK